MPMRIQHIRVPEADDNNQLVGLIRQLIGLEPLLDVASLVDKLVHKGQRFLKYAQDEDIQGKGNGVSKLLEEAQEKIRNLDPDINLLVKIETKKPIPDSQLKNLNENKRELDLRQTNGFQKLEKLAFDEFNPSKSDHQQHVTDTINQLHLDIRRQKEPNNLPPVLREIENLSQRVGEESFVALKSILPKAANDLDNAIEWANRQKKDVLLRLRAAAAEHFEDSEDPLCPLCKQSIKGSKHHDLIKDLNTLKTDAEIAQKSLADASRRIEQEVKSAAQLIIPNNFMQIKHFAVKQDIRNRVQETLVDADRVSDYLPGFAEITQAAIESALRIGRGG